MIYCRQPPQLGIQVLLLYFSAAGEDSNLLWAKGKWWSIAEEEGGWTEGKGKEWGVSNAFSQLSLHIMPLKIWLDLCLENPSVNGEVNDVLKSLIVKGIRAWYGECDQGMWVLCTLSYVESQVFLLQLLDSLIPDAGSFSSKGSINTQSPRMTFLK